VIKVNIEESRKKIKEYYEKAINGDEGIKLILKGLREEAKQFDKLMEENENDIELLMQIGKSDVGPISNTEILKYLGLSMYYHKMTARNQNALFESIVTLQNKVYYYQKIFMEMYSIISGRIENLTSGVLSEEDKKELVKIQKDVEEMKKHIEDYEEFKGILDSFKQKVEERMNKKYKSGIEVA